MRKAIKVSGGHAVKRKARIEHECSDCRCIIELGEEYYQLTLSSYHLLGGWITKHVCEQRWKGRELKA